MILIACSKATKTTEPDPVPPPGTPAGDDVPKKLFPNPADKPWLVRFKAKSN